ncbi:MAG: putative DNA helicase ino80 [Cirrosporium novae-zelandiae]|nr:MAG: putative DNA helicase ino80 [Cirrosporium novae-zelandiae]
MSGVNSQHHMPPYSAHSPTQSSQFITYSPTHSSHPRPILNHDQYQPRQSPPAPLPLPPGPPQSPRFHQQPSPLNTTFPSINGGASATDLPSQYSPGGTSPYQLHRNSHPQLLPLKPAPPPPPSRNYHDSPQTHAHPLYRQDSVPQSPIQRTAASPAVRYDSGAYQTKPMDPPTQEKPSRASNPMSFASILSGPTESSEPTPRAQSTPRQTRKSSNVSKILEAPSMDTKSSRSTKEDPVTPAPVRVPDVKPEENEAPEPEVVKRDAPVKQRTMLSEREKEKVSKAMARIDVMELSDVDSPKFEDERKAYQSKSKKRELEIQASEAGKRKRRRIAYATQFSQEFRKRGTKTLFRQRLEQAAQLEVQKKDLLADRERKKDMQRKRRREATVHKETQKEKEALEKAQQCEDEAERERFLKEASKAQKKARNTQKILDRGDAPEEIREVTPLAPNLEGGTMSSFHMDGHATPEPNRRKSGRQTTSTRPKKSKEKKQSEKDRAAAAYAAMERAGTTDDLVHIAPKEEAPKEKEVVKKEPKELKEPVEPEPSEPSPAPAANVVNYTSKGYNQIYDQIWRDLARKDIPKVARVKDNSTTVRTSNLRKTAQLASKEARRWQLKTNKSVKEIQARAKRTMREMMSFWKRNEREERDLRRLAEKQELENAKKAEADREANRQKRKLNFLISQTELYSHFIGRKIKTDEVERSTDSVSAATHEKITTKPAAHTVTLPDSVKPGTKVTNFEDLDFDAEDETALKEAAMANAQQAVQQAQDRARAFNGEEENKMAQFDEGEMNFQNPTSLGDMDVEQPKMLTAQLKEYQLKGLNWLVNLYEQGINGILADEMGLGKTVQSISVMAYLAEKHNIWGPFLVIAPASTLHNWQQEITKFVPDLKVLPYWGNAKDRKTLRKFWDRKHITYTQSSEFHVLVTSYQLVVQDTQYFQKIKWQYMILDEAQAIKSSQSSRWKNLLGFHCRNRLLLTGTPIQNNMQELWALLHFIMPTLFDSHDEFSDWFSKDIESHAQSNTKLNEDQLKRLHMILKPFMLRRIKKHVQKELGDKVEKDVFCDLTYRQRAYYANLRNKISIMDLIEKASVGDQDDTATLMNLVMQFRKVCNHPDLFERAETTSPLSFATFAQTASFIREGHDVTIGYSIHNPIKYDLPRMLCSSAGRIDVPGPDNQIAGFRGRYIRNLMNIWTPENIRQSMKENEAFSWLRFTDTSPGELHQSSKKDIFQRAVDLSKKSNSLGRLNVIYDEEDENSKFTPVHAFFNIVERNNWMPLAEATTEHCFIDLTEVSTTSFHDRGLFRLEQCATPAASAPPIEIICSDQNSIVERENEVFNIPMRQALFDVFEQEEQALLEKQVDPASFPVTRMLPPPISEQTRYTNISVPSMRRFVTDSGKLAKLDDLLRELKNNNHRVLLYFQMTRMIDLMEEYLTYRNYKYLRLDGSTKLEDRRDTVHDFQTRPEIFIFLLSTRAGGLGINLTSADTVIFYDSDWNPTIDSQAMDRAHRLGQTKQVTVYRMITRGTIEERIRKRALQKEEVQRVVISGGAGAHVDFNTRSRENRTKDIAMWLADDDEAELIEQKEKEAAENAIDETQKKAGKKVAGRKRARGLSLDEMYHEGEGNFDDGSNKPSGINTPVSDNHHPLPADIPGRGRGRGGTRKGPSKRAKTTKERLRIADGEVDGAF